MKQLSQRSNASCPVLHHTHGLLSTSVAFTAGTTSARVNLDNIYELDR